MVRREIFLELILLKNYVLFTATVLATLVLPNEDKRFPVGGNINISCKTDGWPLPSVTWLKDNQPLEPSDRIQISGKAMCKKGRNFQIQLYSKS